MHTGAASVRSERRFTVMGTTAHAIVQHDGGNPGATGALLDLAERRLQALNRRWSRFDPDSEVSQLNRSGGRPLVVSPDTFTLIATAIDAWHRTGGRFDPTVGGCLVAAGYDRSFEAITQPPSDRPPIPPAPTPTGIDLHDYAGSVTVPAGVSLDLGGLAKGYAADLVAAELLEAGAAGCCVNIGGDLRVAGTPPRAEGWRVSLPCPGAASDGDAGTGRSVGLVDGAVCTSTTRLRRWQGSSGPEHHLRDPATGLAIDSGLTTVTVLAAKAVQAEVLTKAALAAGPERAPAVVTEAGATGLLVTDTGAVVELPGLAPFLAAAAAGTAARTSVDPDPVSVG